MMGSGQDFQIMKKKIRFTCDGISSKNQQNLYKSIGIQLFITSKDEFKKLI